MQKQKFTSRPLYKQKRIRIPTHIQLLICLLVFIAPLSARTGQEPYEQEFLITAYYSPLPNQCCYVKGGYEADKVLNGHGIAGADGTAVYPGMIAAPASYAFGTKVELPGIGTFTVHDRGGAINELQGGVHRLDIWVGHGEAGLARALEVGLVKVKGTVYPKGSSQPATTFNFETFNVPLDRLKQFQLSATNLLDVAPSVNDFSYSTVMLQEKLQELGYFQHAITGKFGEVTQSALHTFIQDYQVGQSDTQLTKRTAAHMLAAVRRKNAQDPIQNYVDSTSSETTLKEAQRILRFLGYYSGRTDGKYSPALADAILAFQQENWLVGTKQDPGAGKIGPITLQHLRALWDRTLVTAQAERLLLLQEVKEHVQEYGSIQQFLAEGNYGPQVRLLQTMLAQRGFFPTEDINGSFGPRTKQAVVEYQIAQGIIASAKGQGAGVIGPKTLSMLQQEEMKSLYRLVRAEGLQVL